MSTSKPPETPATGDTPAATSGTEAKNLKSGMIFTVFPRDATAKQIADALNELRRRQRGNVGDGGSKGNL